MLRTVAFLLVAALLSGCGTGDLAATVTRFHRDLPPPGKTFTIQAEDRQRGSIEFANYAALVTRELESLGYRSVADGKADLVVTFSYGVDSGRSEIVSTPDYAQEFLLQRYPCVPGPGVFGCFDSTPNIQTYTVFASWLELNILDGGRLRKGEPFKLFESRSTSQGLQRDPALLIPALITATFVDYPGPNGQPRIIVVPRPPRPTRG